ncbi:MAG TPA: DUF2339 domain-containing protein, partial [Candidatus Angelobacter sp.]
MEDPSFLLLAFLCIAALFIYIRRINKLRRHDTEKLIDTASALTGRVHALEQQLKFLTETTSGLASRIHDLVQAPATAESHAAKAPPPVQVPAPVSRAAPVPETRPVAPPGTPLTVFSHGAEAAHAPKIAADERPPQVAPPALKKVGGIPLTPSAPPAITPPPAAPAKHAAPAAAEQPSTAALAARVAEKLAQKAAAGATASTAAAPPLTPPIAPPAAARVQAPAHAPFENYAARSAPAITIPKIRKPAKPPRPKITLEEIGTKWLPKVGITILVLGVALYTASKWEHVPDWARILIFYLLGAGMLALGIFFERKDKYKILGRVLIGGGWAISFFTTYAMRHVETAQVIQSDVLDLFLMLAVAAAMVWHTLRYNSQLVTGASFLLGFVAVSISHETAFSMSAGAILALGLTVLVVKRQWFELEVFGIIASYANHLYWLYQTFQRFGHEQFEGYWSSVALMVSYWAIFRTSYLIRKPANKKQESISTIAALLNPLFFMAVMKYQSFHPEWAFYALLSIGAVEFTLGQLPMSRRRTVPFQILSSLGATLMIVAVPFKYGRTHALEILWMAGAEAFLLAGVLTRERLFRWFGGITSLLVAAYLFGWPESGVVAQAAKLFNGEPYRDASLSIVLAVVAGLFYINSHVIGRFWQQLFDREVEQQALTIFSFAASIFAVGAVYTAADRRAVAVLLAVLVTALAWTGKQFRISTLLYQAHWIALVAIAEVSITGFHLDAAWHSIPQRLITFGLVAALLYVSSNFVHQETLPWAGEAFVFFYRWAGSGLLALLIWMQLSLSVPRREWLIAVLWTALALALSAAGQLLKRSEFKWQAFTLAMMSFLGALYLNFDATQEFHGLTYRLISVTLVAGGNYLLARWTPIARVKPCYSWAGTILFGYLAYRETEAQHQLWTPVLWIGLATVLGLAGRFWKDRSLLWQTHLLAAAATLWTLLITFQSYHDTPAHLATMLIVVPITAALLYAFTWVTAVPQFAETSSVKPAYTWAGTVLFGYLAYTQTVDHHELWTPVIWIGMAAALAVAARFWKDRHLLWQTHLLAVAATGWTIYVSFLGHPDGTRAQLVTVLITSAVLYGLTWMVNLAGLIESDRIWQTYSWAGSLLLTWLGWYQLQSPNRSLAWGVFALVIFEIGYGAKSSYLRLQAYIAVASSFAYLFFSNFTLLQPGTLDPHIFLIVLLVLVYFWIYWRLREKGEDASATETRLHIAYALPYLGTATIAALARFSIADESVVIGYAAVVLAALVVAWLLRLQVFLHQALIML